ncbi:MAG: hypothetical protein KDD50_12695 [Bdellovibrionales bacterium]|nr:hypothetical protein [Bdellovibrionales bacterium]
MGLIKYVKMMALGFSVLSLIACANQRGFEGITDIPSSVNKNGEVEVDLGDVQMQADVATQSITNAQTEIAEVQNIQFGGVWDLLKIGKIKDSLMSGFDKIADKLTGVKDKLTNAKISIQLKIDQLDENNPLHQNALIQLKKMLASIEKLELKLDNSIQKLKTKVEALFDKVDGLLAKIRVGGIIGDIVSFGLRMTLEDLKMDVMYRFDDLLVEIGTTT